MTEQRDTINEPSRRLPVLGRHDVCVIGGSCTGVFAAIRAARLGADVGVIERQNMFGGTATAGLVCVWHSVRDANFDRQIIAGLTTETMDRLEKRRAVERFEKQRARAFVFNSCELAIELDEMVLENGVTPYLNTQFSMPCFEDQRLKGVIVESKSGRGVVLADVFIDASGDGDLAARMGLPFTVGADLQPPTTCAHIADLTHPDQDLKTLIHDHGEEFGLEPDSGWHRALPDNPDVTMLAETHVFGTNAVDHASLTRAEMKGRRQIRAVMDIVRKYASSGRPPSLLALPSLLGIRETRRFEADYCLTETDVLSGRTFDDSVANCTYRVDVHHTEKGGWIFKYLDGTTFEVDADGSRHGRWREETDENPTYYQIPYRTMVTRKADNLIMAGRMICADQGAYGAIRVMTNLNQTGEAAGCAAVLSLKSQRPVHAVDSPALHQCLAEGGSIVLATDQ